MKTDWERVVKNLIKKGSVFYFPENSFSRPYPHYFVVLNNNPAIDSEIHMVSAKSFNSLDICRFETENFPRETFVDVAKGECSLFTRLTLFDCNSVNTKNITALANKMESGSLQDKGYIGNDILARLCAGVKSSMVIADEIKDKI
jgi:hypothetical protein